MAIDTYSKRLSVMNLGLPWRQTLPEPDGSFDQGDRQHLLGLYSGVESAAATVGFFSAAWFIAGGLWGVVSIRIPIDAADVPYRRFDWHAQDRQIDWTTQHRSMDWTGQER